MLMYFGLQTFVPFAKTSSSLGILPTSKTYWLLLLRKLYPVKGGKQWKLIQKLARRAYKQCQFDKKLAEEVKKAAGLTAGTSESRGQTTTEAAAAVTEQPLQSPRRNRTPR